MRMGMHVSFFQVVFSCEDDRWMGSRGVSVCISLAFPDMPCQCLLNNIRLK